MGARNAPLELRNKHMQQLLHQQPQQLQGHFGNFFEKVQTHDIVAQAHLAFCEFNPLADLRCRCAPAN